MSDFGLTDAGFNPKTFDDVRASISTRVKTAFGVDIKSDRAQAAIGQIVGIFASAIAELWELGEALYHVVDPDAAQAAALDEVCAITGTVRETPMPSHVSRVYLIATGSTPLVPAGSIISETNTGERFSLDVDTQIFGRFAWTLTTFYHVDLDVVINDSGKLYACIQSGTSAGSGGPTGTGAAIADGGVIWSYIGTGDCASGPTTASSEDPGPITAVAGSLAVIETPVGGWAGVTNLNDAVPGTLLESDGNLRLRRIAELEPGAASTADAVRTEVLAVTGVTACSVYHNDTDTTDADATTPHTVRCVVLGGTDADVAAAIYKVIGCGINTQGGHLVNFTDAEGIVRPIYFERPTAKPIYVDITLTYDANGSVGPAYPSDGDTEVEDGIAAFGETYPSGKDVTSSALLAKVFQVVTGVLDVSLVKIGLAPSPGSSSTIVITKFQIATFDSSHVVVHSSAGTP